MFGSRLSRQRRVLRSLVPLLAVVALSAGCDLGWPQPNAGPDRSNVNPGEAVLSAGNVAQLTSKYTVRGSTGAAVVGIATAYVASDTTLWALNKTTGQVLWTRDAPAGTKISGGPFVENGDRVRVSYGTTPSTEVVYDSNGNTVSTEAVPGQLITERGEHRVHSMPGNSVGTTPPWSAAEVTGTSLSGFIGYPFGITLGSDYLYVVRGIGTNLNDLAAYRLDEPCPNTDFEECPTAWTTAFGSLPAYAGDPAIGPDGTLYLASGNDSQYPYLTAVDHTNGSFRWKIMTSMHGGAPAVTDNVVYTAGSTDFASDPNYGAKVLEAHAVDDGRLLWKAELPGAGRSVETAAVGGSVVFASAGPHVYAFDAGGCGTDTCPPLWSADLPGTKVAGLAVTGGELYASTDAGLEVFGLQT